MSQPSSSWSDSWSDSSPPQTSFSFFSVFVGVSAATWSHISTGGADNFYISYTACVFIELAKLRWFDTSVSSVAVYRGEFRNCCVPCRGFSGGVSSCVQRWRAVMNWVSVSQLLVVACRLEFSGGVLW